MEIANLVGGIGVLIPGILVRFFRMNNLVAGYNTAPAAEKESYDQERLAKYVGNFIILLAVILLAGWALVALGGLSDAAARVAWVLFGLVTVVGLVFLNTGNRLKKTE